MKVALDTNVLVYAEGLNGPAKAAVARRLLGQVLADACLPVQVAAEFYNVLTLKAGVARTEAVGIVSSLTEMTTPLATTPAVLAEALELAASARFRIFDALILATAASAGCILLLSEDLQDGFVYRGTTVANPFAETPHPLLASVLETLSGRPE
ncbi:MAG: PIN domain-containing protein [Brevundimonas sp.]|uniref:PIN domain-containing protein n=1 Tax=Brevundimonas sp. TaxID=1871086 RepID=UPI0025BCD02C|nr:PIN domain-containing protein [Brevundimonas sp.]MBX3477049.1 PIN domain-containing protein [Brevundimonas sp.]